MIKRKLNLFLIVLFCMIALNLLSQTKVDTFSVCYLNGFTNRMEYFEEYQIINCSTEDYLSWISLEPTNDRTDFELIHDYFKKRKGDYNLIEMMNDNLLENYPVNIGYTFLSNIKPGMKFSYIISTQKNDSDFYKSRIVLLKRKKVEAFLKMKIDSINFYNLPNVFLK